jgi:hypothetical protein
MINVRFSARASLLLVCLLARWVVAQPADLGWADNYQLEQAEILVDQARRAIQESRYADAESLLDQALQINRASNGLYDPSQLALLDQLLETLLLQGKWEAFDQRLDYIGWLNRRINAADPDQLTAGLLRQSEWHRAAAGVIQRSQSAWYLIQGKYLNWQAVSVLENSYGRQDPRLAPILYQIALEHYYQSVLIERRGTTSYEFKTDGKAIANGWMFSRNESVQRSYRIGRENLQRVRDLYGAVPEVPESTDALLQIYQADWEFLYGNNGEALELYQDAYYKLLDAGIAEPEVERYFNQLVKIPAQQLQTEWVAPESADGESAVEFYAWSTLYPGAETPVGFLQPPFQLPSDGSQSVQVQLRLEVTGNPNSGRFSYGVTGVDILAPDLEDETVVDRVFAEVPLVKFRPRLVAGEVTSHDPFMINYRFASE